MAIYRECNENHLCQGDILYPERLRACLEGHQDYYANKPYFYRFILLTQTCDLAREKDRANFLFIAVVRRLSEAIGMRQFEEGAKDSTRQLLMDLLSHRYNKRGFFYLPQNEQQGIEEPSVVDLRVVFSLHKAHYTSLFNARCGGLSELHVAHLGQLIAQMFNRIALPEVAGSDIKQEVRNIMELIGKRENARLNELLEASSDKTCSIEYCKEEAKTFRWLKIWEEDERMKEQEQLLCLEHAHQYDNGNLSPECFIKSDSSDLPSESNVEDCRL